MDNPAFTHKSRLAESAYNSPYSRTGAPGIHPNTDLYAPLRARALLTLEAMGYEPRTMVERGVLWAEDQDPFGHFMQSQFMNFLGSCFIRFMESFDEFLDEQEHSDMLNTKSIMLAVRKCHLDIWKQVRYPDSLIVANRQEHPDPDRNHSTTSLFSLKQQVIVAEVKSSAVFVDCKTGRPVDIRTVGGGWSKLYEGLIKKADHARQLKDKWDCQRSRSKAAKKPVKAKI